VTPYPEGADPARNATRADDVLVVVVVDVVVGVPVVVGVLVIIDR
jgi:hypothetical protein